MSRPASTLIGAFPARQLTDSVQASGVKPGPELLAAIDAILSDSVER